MLNKAYIVRENEVATPFLFHNSNIDFPNIDSSIIESDIRGYSRDYFITFSVEKEYDKLFESLLFRNSNFEKFNIQISDSDDIENGTRVLYGCYISNLTSYIGGTAEVSIIFNGLSHIQPTLYKEKEKKEEINLEEKPWMFDFAKDYADNLKKKKRFRDQI